MITMHNELTTSQYLEYTVYRYPTHRSLDRLYVPCTSISFSGILTMYGYLISWIRYMHMCRYFIQGSVDQVFILYTGTTFSSKRTMYRYVANRSVEQVYVYVQVLRPKVCRSDIHTLFRYHILRYT